MKLTLSIHLWCTENSCRLMNRPYYNRTISLYHQLYTNLKDAIRSILTKVMQDQILKLHDCRFTRTINFTTARETSDKQPVYRC